MKHRTCPHRSPWSGILILVYADGETPNQTSVLCRTDTRKGQPGVKGVAVPLVAGAERGPKPASKHPKG